MSLLHPFFPPASFYYSVAIDGIGVGQLGSFQEVSGIEVTTETETISEAGLNGYSHKVPKRTSFPNLVLKRGLFIQDKRLLLWLQMTVLGGLGGKVETKPIIITLYDPDGMPHASWCFANAYPVKWSHGGLNSMENKIAVETIEFAYSYWQIL